MINNTFHSWSHDQCLLCLQMCFSISKNIPLHNFTSCWSETDWPVLSRVIFLAFLKNWDKAGQLPAVASLDSQDFKNYWEASQGHQPDLWVFLDESHLVPFGWKLLNVLICLEESSLENMPVVQELHLYVKLFSNFHNQIWMLKYLR